MSSHRTTLSLVAFCAAVVFIAGCIPEDSLEWSEDGSVGLLKIGEGLYIVDGETGELTRVVKGEIGLLPDISGDDLLAMVKKRIPHCIRVMLTGATETDMVSDQVAENILHCQRFITKPWNDDQLRDVISECLRQYEESTSGQ